MERVKKEYEEKQKKKKEEKEKKEKENKDKEKEGDKKEDKKEDEVRAARDVLEISIADAAHCFVFLEKGEGEREVACP